MYVVLEGFDQPDFIHELSESRVGIGAIVQARAANLEGDAAYAEPPPEEREDPKENRKSLESYRRAVLAYAAASPDGSGLRNVCWHELPVGHLGAIEPEELFTKVASIAYLTLERRKEYHQYLESLDRNVVPAATSSASVPETYTAFVDAAGGDRCNVEVVIDSLLRAVVAAAGETDDGPSDASQDDAGEMAAAAGVYRYHDAASIGIVGLAPSARDAALVAGRRVVAASVGAAYTEPTPPRDSVRAETELHRLIMTSSLPEVETEAAWRIAQFEKLLQV